MPQSPFSPQTRRWSFGLDWMLLMTLVAATTAALFGYALFLPSVTSELNAWLGRPVPAPDVGESRRAQITFLVVCYSAPLILGLVARVIHLGGTMLAERVQAPPADDEQFRME